MNFVLFVLLNAVLFVRPEELYPSIAGLRLFMLLIVPCVLLSLRQITHLLSSDALQRRPVAVCVLLFYASTLVTQLVAGNLEGALLQNGPGFGKVILYYFLLLAVVNTPERLRALVAALVVQILVLTAIALAQQYGVATFPSIKPAMQTMFDAETGERYTIPRMASSGIFSDPNDLCLVLGLGILCCVYGATTGSPGPVGLVLWALPVPVFVAALLETHSRGGLLGVLAGGGAYLYSRFGGARALPLAAAGAAAALVAVGGRQADVGSGGGTAHERMIMWAEGLHTLFQRPLAIPTGLGFGWYPDEFGLVAHNSFVEAYVELGLLGGGAFLGAFLLALRLIDRLGKGIEAAGWALEARPFAFAVLAAYAVGCYSLTRNYVIPTYLVLGLASVLLETSVARLPVPFQVNREWFTRAVLFAIGGLVFMKFATQGLGMAGI
ncbi:O-antigen ligase family protein [Frigoriglobus tundricola]|uniref:Membrane protein SypL involved in exopolysaccharide production n=1 Tax=Frigoriglobus tundricola TaxID=2774151 RepID=A0A6M5YVE6_9BACT|nr:O-antigen ligase family protein [Frigoriglobus tundricola]QJW98047.1 Membrane protein SypL involved in exopolysaccharide production [Frigoriglobus tundricola]